MLSKLMTMPHGGRRIHQVVNVNKTQMLKINGPSLKQIAAIKCMVIRIMLYEF